MAQHTSETRQVHENVKTIVPEDGPFHVRQGHGRQICGPLPCGSAHPWLPNPSVLGAPAD